MPKWVGVFWALAFTMPFIMTWRSIRERRYPALTGAVRFLVAHAAALGFLACPFISSRVVELVAEILFVAYVAVEVTYRQRAISKVFAANPEFRARIADPRSILIERFDNAYGHVSASLGYTVIQAVTVACHIALWCLSVSNHAALP